MKHALVENEVLETLEELFTEEALTASKVASAMDYLKESYKKMGVYEIPNYACEINRHFGYPLLNGPFGTMHYGGEKTVYIFSFILDVDSLLLLNQRGQPSMLDRILRKVSPKREERVNNKITRFCKGFYADMKDFDWESRNMKYPSSGLYNSGLEVKVKETTTLTQATTKEF